jgi:hypothetical protein
VRICDEGAAASSKTFYSGMISTRSLGLPLPLVNGLQLTIWELFFSVDTALKNSLELWEFIRNFVNIISAF